MDVTRPATYDLTDYLGALRRSWWIALLAALLGLAAAGGYTLTQKRTYESSASVLVQPTGVQDTNVVGGRTKGDINLDTEAQLVKSTAVAEDAGLLLRSTDKATQLAHRVTVAVPPNTSVLVVTYRATNRRDAQAGAHSFAEAYLANRNDSAKAELTNQYNTLDHKIKQITTDLAGIDSKLVASGGKADLDSRRQNLSNQLNTLTARFNQLTTTTVNGGKIISDADLPKMPTKPSVPLNLGSGALAGLVLGLGLALGRERLDRRIRRGVDLTRRADIPLLAEPRADADRTYARLRNELACGTDRVLVVAAVSEGRAATVVAAELAAAFEHAGNEVRLVTRYAEELTEQVHIEDARRHLTQLRATTEFVIIEAPAMSVSADAQSLASLADAAILAVELRRSTLTEMFDAAEQLRRVDTTLLGGVVVPRLGPAPAAANREAEKQPQLT